jgi:hypothetical protein
MKQPGLSLPLRDSVIDALGGFAARANELIKRHAAPGGIVAKASDPLANCRKPLSQEDKLQCARPGIRPLWVGAHCMMLLNAAANLGLIAHRVEFHPAR